VIAAVLHVLQEAPDQRGRHDVADVLRARADEVLEGDADDLAVLEDGGRRSSRVDRRVGLDREEVRPECE